MRNYSKSAIVTGGAGFIGSHMVDYLMSKKFKTIVIDDISGGHLSNLKKHLKNKNFKLIKKDICKINKKEKFFNKIDYVFHFAGVGDIVPSIENPKRYLNTNIYGTLKILEACRYSKIKKLVYAASSSCYGIIKKNIVNEEHPISLQHPYALSKYLGEKALLHWGKIYNVPVVSLRIFNAYGPRVRTTGAYGAALGVFFKQKIKKKPFTVIGDGKQSRDFVHVKDLVKVFYKAAVSKIKFEKFNIGTGKSKSVNHLCRLLGGEKIRIPNRPGEAKHSTADITKAKKLLKWKPVVNFDLSIKELVKNNLSDWKNAPLWTPKKIKKATKNWFKYIR